MYFTVQLQKKCMHWVTKIPMSKMHKHVLLKHRAVINHRRLEKGS